MTVLVAVNTKDAIVLATDSQGTLTRTIIEPDGLSSFFELDNGRRMKIDSEGQPALDTWARVTSQTAEMPYKIHHKVEKIFSLDPLDMGIMASGISAIDDRSIKSLITEFKNSYAFTDLTLKDYTLQETAEILLGFLWPKYNDLYNSTKPELELMVCGYDKARYTPGIVRIHVHDKLVSKPDYDYCIFFGGITREIQRLLFGIDAVGKARLIEKSQEVLKTYRSHLESHLHSRGIEESLPGPEEFGGDLGLFHELDIGALRMSCASYSEQDAVECADFLVNVMIKTQKFSDQFPSTGGHVQVAVISKDRGFESLP